MTEERMNIAVLGDRDSIYCYAALGMDTFPVADAQEGRDTLARLTGLRYAVIYITEQLASQLEPELLRCRDERIPAIIPIPGVTGSTGYGMNAVRQSVERAVGSDIIFGGDK